MWGSPSTTSGLERGPLLPMLELVRFPPATTLIDPRMPARTVKLGLSDSLQNKAVTQKCSRKLHR
jgi:hypothetical protein